MQESRSHKDVRLAIETRLQLNAGALQGRKSDIFAAIDEVLSESDCASCQADLSDRKDDDLLNPNDSRLYCVSCWKAMALGRPT